MKLNKVHHIAFIASDYGRSLNFYTRVLGLTVIAENYREERESYKTDLALNGEYIIKFFTFPNPPAPIVMHLRSLISVIMQPHCSLTARTHLHNA
ncbi:MAG: VOC family protein [Muribaculaceae bacterium]|nr:VOC family protein [Muribaculaceae bacterium]